MSTAICLHASLPLEGSMRISWLMSAPGFGGPGSALATDVAVL